MNVTRKVTTNQERLNELFNSDPRNDTAIAEALGVSKQALSAWKTGTRSPGKKMLFKISETFDVSIEWLMGYDYPKKRRSLDDPLFYFDEKLTKKDEAVLDALLNVLVEYAQTDRRKAKNILLALMESGVEK